jgi:hypothetical protein
MVTFQAPFDIMDMQRQQQQQSQFNQQQIMQGLGQLAGAYAENKQMKNDAKIYGELLKFAGPAIGDTKGELLANYKQMDEREQANFGRTLFGGGLFPTMSQSYNFGRNAGIRENAPMLNAGLQGAARVAGGEGTVPLPVEPPIPAIDNTTPPPAPQPSPDAMSAATAWYNQSNRGMMQSGTMRPFYR